MCHWPRALSYINAFMFVKLCLNIDSAPTVMINQYAAALCPTPWSQEEQMQPPFTGTSLGTNTPPLVTSATIMQCSIAHNVWKTMDFAYEGNNYSYIYIFQSIYLCLYFFLSINLHINVSIYQSIYFFYLSLYLYVYPSVYSFIYLYISLSLYQSIYISIYLSIYIFTSITIFLYIYRSSFVYLPILLIMSPSIHLSIYKSIFLICTVFSFHSLSYMTFLKQKWTLVKER